MAVVAIISRAVSVDKFMLLPLWDQDHDFCSGPPKHKQGIVKGF